MQQLDTKHLTHTKTLQGHVCLVLCKYFMTQSSLKCHSWRTRSYSLPAAAHRAAAAKPSTPPEPWQAALHAHTCIGHSISNQSHGVTPLRALLITEK